MISKTTWVKIILAILILGLGVYLGFSLGRSHDRGIDTKLSSLIYNENKKIDSLERVVSSKDSMVVSLLKNLSKVKKSGKTRIEKVKKLSTKDGVKYLDKKLREVDKNNKDSLKFFSSKDSNEVVISASHLKIINGMIEENEVLKEELVISDSIIVKQKSELEDKDKIINSVKSREEKEVGYYKDINKSLEKSLKKEKIKKNAWKIGTGVSVLALVILLL